MLQRHMNQSGPLDRNLAANGENKMPRRSFLCNTLGVCIAGSALPTFLGGCSSEPIKLTWISSLAPNNSFDFLVKIFNATNQDNIQVTRLPEDTYKYISLEDQQYMYSTRQLKGQKPQPDILSLDVVWMKEFATRGWIYPLDQYWRDTLGTDNYYKKLQDIYLQKPLETVHFRIAENQPQQIWGTPHHTDAGILYYRTDMPDIINPDSEKAKLWTWDDIKRMCKEAKANGRTGTFAWQGNNFEGLVCNFVEVLSGYGGQIFDDPVQPMHVTMVVVNKGLIEKGRI